LRLLFLNRCFYPDVEATGQLLAELCADLAKRHDVTVIAGQPNFSRTGPLRSFIQRERHERVEVLRVRNVRFTKRSVLGRAAGLISYLLLAFWAGLFLQRPDLIVVETDPPFLGALGALLKWWHRCPLIYYLQDLFPEVGLAIGRLRPGILTSFLKWTTQLGLRQADRVVVLGEDMRERVLQRGIAASKVAIVPNWADTTVVRPAKENNSLRRHWGVHDKFVVMYSGNLGLSQPLDHVLLVAQQLRQEPIEFLLVGEGASKAGLMAKAAAWSLTNVRFLPYQSKERLSESLSAADLHLLPLRRGLAGCMVPSKLYGILASGTAYVAAVDHDSEVARVTRSGHAGLLIEPDSPEQLVQAIRWCLHERHELSEMGGRGRRLAESLFDRKLAVAKFQRVLQAAVAAAPFRSREPLGVVAPVSSGVL